MSEEGEELTPEQMKERHQNGMMEDLIEGSNKWLKKHGIDPNPKQRIPVGDPKDDKDEKEVKVTTIVGPQADDLIAALKAGGGISYRDVSVRGLTVLEVYTDDCGYWAY